MTNKEAIKILQNIWCYQKSEIYDDKEIREAIDKSIEALMKAYSLEHVIIKHPKYGNCDGWIDRQRMFLFTDPITCEFAIKCGITWEADNGQ